MAYRLFVKPILGLLAVFAVLTAIYLLPEYRPDHRMASEAILAGDAERLALYLRRGLDPNDRSRWRSSLRFSFLRSGPSASRERGSLADAPEALLSRALEGCTVSLAGMLVAAGADVNVRARSGETALWQAAVCGEPGMVQSLLSRGADVNARSPDGGTALWEKTNIGWRHRPLPPEVVRILEAAGAARP